MPKYLIECEFSGEGGLGDEDLKTIIQKAFGDRSDGDSSLNLLEGYVSSNKMYCVCTATDEDTVHKQISSDEVSVTAIARIVVSTDVETSEPPDSTEEALGDGLAFPTKPASDAFGVGTGAGTALKKKETTKKKLGPVGNLIGMVVFGAVGLVLGFVVLLFIPDDNDPTYGKAGRIIKMFPKPVQTWLHSSNDSPIGSDKSGGSWDIGGSRDDSQTGNAPVNSNDTDADTTTNGTSPNTRKIKSQKLPTEGREYRIFKDNTGEHQTDAYLETVEGQTVYLKKRSGETKEVPMNRLSEQDQKWIRDEMKRRKSRDN